MATQVQNRRGTTAEHSTFTGANGELTVDTTKRTLVVHDGATAGGRPLLREDQSNLPTSAPTTGIYNASGSLAISTGGSGRLFVDASGRVGIGTAPLYGILTARAGTNCNFHIRTPSEVGSSGEGVAIDSLSDNAGSLRALFMRATEHVFLGSSSERARIDSSGRFLVGTSSDSGGALLQVNGDRIRVGTAKTPASATATGTAGEICWDASYVYVCTATNTWKRSALSTW